MTQYERKMTIRIGADEWGGNPKMEEMIQGDLHWLGLSQVPSYFYGTEDDIKTENYGHQWIEDKKSSYEITINGKEAFSLEYASEARLAVKGLNASGYEADYRRVISSKSYEGWVSLNGRYFVASFNDMEGEFTNIGKGPGITYENGVLLVTEFWYSYGRFNIEFTITYETDDIKNKKRIENMLVDTPLNDMRYIRHNITECLKAYQAESSELIIEEIDCSSRIISEANYDCSPESVGKVMNDE